jgi:hypothetical protein
MDRGGRRESWEREKEGDVGRVDIGRTPLGCNNGHQSKALEEIEQATTLATTFRGHQPRNLAFKMG